MAMIKGFGFTPSERAVEMPMGMSSTAVALLLSKWVLRLVRRMNALRIRFGLCP